MSVIFAIIVLGLMIIGKEGFPTSDEGQFKIDVEMPYTKQDEIQKTECKKCNSTGYLVYTKVIKDGNRVLKNQYACLCNCGNAKKYEGWNVSDKRYKSEFYTPFAQEIGLKI